MKRYDKDEDNVLSKAEFSGIRSLPSKADGNKDGKVTLDELVVAYGGKSGSSASTSRQRSNRNNEYLVQSAKDRGNDADREFKELDKNTAGLVQMHEFSSRWTDELAETFTKLDANNDGTLTATEWSKGGGLKSSRSSRYSKSGSSGSSSSRYSRSDSDREREKESEKSNPKDEKAD